MTRLIETFAKAKLISLRQETRNADGIVVAVDNEGQTGMALIPNWKDWGRELIDGTKLEEGKYYKIIIEIEE